MFVELLWMAVQKRASAGPPMEFWNFELFPRGKMTENGVLRH